MDLHDNINQAVEDININLEGCRKRLEKMRASPRTDESHIFHAEGMIDGLEVAIKLLKDRFN